MRNVSRQLHRAENVARPEMFIRLPGITVQTAANRTVRFE